MYFLLYYGKRFITNRLRMRDEYDKLYSFQIRQQKRERENVTKENKICNLR